jgi:hypothetical protein
MKIMIPVPFLPHTANSKRDPAGSCTKDQSSLLPVKAAINPWPQQSFFQSYKFGRRPGVFVFSSFPFFSFLSSLCLLA